MYVARFNYVRTLPNKVESVIEYIFNIGASFYTPENKEIDVGEKTDYLE
jgi:hypothetical protein